MLRTQVLRQRLELQTGVGVEGTLPQVDMWTPPPKRLFWGGGGQELGGEGVLGGKIFFNSRRSGGIPLPYSEGGGVWHDAMV